MNVSIVILHYETISDSRECLNSIEKLNTNNINLSVILVDNGSVKSKIDELQEDNDVIYLKSPKNLGFACGNNLGIYYAKYNLSPDYVVVVNNDVIFYDKDFLQKLYYSNNENADIIGPAIYSFDFKTNQNPIYSLYLDSKSVKARLKRFKLLKFLLVFNLDVFFQNFYIKNIKKLTKIKYEHDDYKLHGACLIFTKNYLDRYDGFYPNTFMYFEEDILKYIAVRDNLKMCYNSDLALIHKEASSTDHMYAKKRLKRKFIYRNSIISLKELIKLMYEDDKK